MGVKEVRIELFLYTTVIDYLPVLRKGKGLVINSYNAAGTSVRIDKVASI